MVQAFISSLGKTSPWVGLVYYPRDFSICIYYWVNVGWDTHSIIESAMVGYVARWCITRLQVATDIDAEHSRACYVDVYV